MTPRRPRAPLRWALLLLALGAGSGLAVCSSVGSSAQVSTTPATYSRALHDALPQRIRDAGVLTFATDASYAPASSFAADGRTIIGFEPDLGAELGRVLGVRVVFTNHDFAGLTAMVAGHQTDAVMSAMTDTAERERVVDFVNYFSAGTSIVVQRGNPSGIEDLASLCGRAVAVEAGTVQVDLLARAQANCTGRRIDVKAFSTNADALLQLRTGQVAAVLNDYPPAVALTADARTRASYQLASTTQYEPGEYGIAVAKDQSKLRDALKGALSQLVRTGVYADVLHRWNVSSGALTSISVNAGAGASTG